MNPTTQPTAPVAPAGGYQNGGWYNGQQYWNGQLGSQGVINNPNQQGYGQAVSAEVQRQSNPTGPLLGGVSDGVNAANGTGGTGSTGLGAPASIDLQGIYDSAVTNNPEYQQIQKDITDKQTAHDTAIKNVNDNPWYSEGRRGGEQAKVDNAFNADMTTLSNRKSAIETAAQMKLNLAQGQYNINRQQYQDNLANLNTLVSSGAFTNATPDDLNKYAVATGISVDMLQGIQQKAADGNIQLVTSTDNNGNLSIVAVNKNNGKIVNQSTVGGVGKSTSTSNTATKNDQVNSASYMIELYNNTNPSNPSFSKGQTLRKNYSPTDFYTQLLLDYPQSADYVKKAFSQGVPKKNPIQ